MNRSSVPKFVVEDLVQLGIDLDDDAVAKSADYLDALLAANRQFNLTSIRDRDEAWRRHIIDSLTLLPGFNSLSQGGCVIDVGSGGGLPGIPLAIARSDLQVTLLEATRKKAQFLKQCVRELNLMNVKVVNDRAETVGHDKAHRQRYDVAVCRAIGPMSPLLECTLPFVKVQGYVLAMKGPRGQKELEAASDALAILGAGEIRVFDAYPESFALNTVIVSVQKARPTPRTYPRPPGMPRRAPL